MENIKAFLLPPVMNEEKEIVISQRFKGEDGKPIPFVVRVIDQETNRKLLKQATIRHKTNGQIMQEFDADKYTRLLVLECTKYPNFRDAELCSFYKTADPSEVPPRMLSIGEHNKLVKAIKEINDIRTDYDEIASLEEEAKN